MKRKTKQILLAVSWLLICTVLLILPGSSFTSSNWWTKIPMFDKWVHIVFFLVLTYLFSLPWIDSENLKPRSRIIFFVIAISCFFYGILMEMIQHYFIPLRSFDLGDILADAVGVLAGFFLLKSLQKN